ncbi:hypothetical protein [Chryseobacterium sp.]|uniref:hypothetical protein n=1 Tax=Chryseobacterium sp. TaxID=1871047 RepID=UPI0011C8977E|nr:hypothetical protein [Chryseobacterium sp.]TXF77728.1 hypothetical protein FUA25_07335 [Chryseobacterium sp.]
MKKGLTLLFFCLLVINCYSQSEVRFPFEIKYQYYRNSYEKPEIISLSISNDHKDLYLISERDSNRIFVENDSYNIIIKSNKIDYSESFLYSRPGARYIKIHSTKDFFEVGRYKARKYIIDLPEYKMLIFVDENSKINNTSFLNKVYGIIDPPKLPTGLVVRVDIIFDGKNNENVWLLQNVNIKSKKVLHINFSQIKLLERNLKKEFGDTTIRTKPKEQN